MGLIPGVPPDLDKRLTKLESTMTDIRDLLHELVEIERARDGSG